ncbi:MAG: rubrerythrin family protein [Anaerolineales bacterium]|nr:rubrerythrin family protein [Anaerolineales bacterium]
MNEMTKENLRAAFAGESQAHMKYLIFADQADKENKPNLANMFRAIAHAERIHATNHFKVLGGIGSTGENLVAAKGGEDFEVDQMYPTYLAVAQLQEEKSAKRSMNYAYEVEKLHSELYAAAQQAVDAGEDISEVKAMVCPVCGFTVLGDDVPDSCPVCGALKKVFKKFSN